jgi:hypothetical protein
LELELLSQPNTSPQLQSESPAPRWSCKLVELLLQSWFGGVGALPNTPCMLPDFRVDPASQINTLLAMCCSSFVQIGHYPLAITPRGWWEICYVDISNMLFAY